LSPYENVKFMPTVHHGLAETRWPAATRRQGAAGAKRFSAARTGAGAAFEVAQRPMSAPENQRNKPAVQVQRYKGGHRRS
jgi:hypothetical protein